MPRIRSIKPQFWLDEQLGTICRDARLLYIGLWNLSDDQGVFEWRPTRIKAQLLPYDHDVTGDNVTEWLELLRQLGDVIKFSVDGKDYGYIPTFLKHQEIKNPSRWRFAEIPENIDDTTPALPQPYPSPTEALPIGSRGVGSRSKVIGNSIYKGGLGELKNVKLSEEEYHKLVKRFGEKDTLERIETLSEYLASKGKHYKSHYATILSWARKDLKQNAKPEEKRGKFNDGWTQ